MVEKLTQSPLDLVDASPRRFELGGAAASLYDAFAAAGLVFFTFLIGSRRAGRQLLRNSRVIAGGGIVTGLPTGVISGTAMIFDHHKNYKDWDPDYFWGSFFGFGSLGLVVGIVGGVVLLWYVNALRNEAFHEFWLRKMEGCPIAEMEVAVDALGESRKSRYYHEFFTAIERGQNVVDAHAAALRRCSPPPTRGPSRV